MSPLPAGLDRRLTPAWDDLAAERLRGIVSAPRYAVGEPRRIMAASTPLWPRPGATAIDTEAIHGEAVIVYDERDGLARVELVRDGYVGFAVASALGPPLAPTHHVVVPRTFVFPAATIKRPPVLAITFGAEVTIVGQEGRFAVTADGGFITGGHLAPVGTLVSDPVALAELFLGVPYLWGGKTSLGLDCSGLVQTVLQAAGVACPRDSDMQERGVGMPIDVAEARRGDLLFWSGHVAMVRDEETIIHANATAMMVAIEPMLGAMARIEAAGDALRTVRRPIGPRD